MEMDGNEVDDDDDYHGHEERYFQNSLGYPSLPTALFFLAVLGALIISISDK